MSLPIQYVVEVLFIQLFLPVLKYIETQEMINK